MYFALSKSNTEHSPFKILFRNTATSGKEQQPSWQKDCSYIAKPSCFGCVFLLLLEISLVRRVLELHIFFLDEMLSELLLTSDNKYDTLGTLNKGNVCSLPRRSDFCKILALNVTPVLVCWEFVFPDCVSLEPSVLNVFSLLLPPWFHSASRVFSQHHQICHSYNVFPNTLICALYLFTYIIVLYSFFLKYIMAYGVIWGRGMKSERRMSICLSFTN